MRARGSWGIVSFYKVSSDLELPSPKALNTGANLSPSCPWPLILVRGWGVGRGTGIHRNIRFTIFLGAVGLRSERENHNESFCLEKAVYPKGDIHPRFPHRPSYCTCLVPPEVPMSIIKNSLLGLSAVMRVFHALSSPPSTVR